MIIRYGGGNAGIKEYLEDGRKMDRHFAREEMDARIPIEGDLNITEAVYKSIEDKGQDRYLHITLSFNEPDVTPELITKVFQQYKEQLMAAYQDDEFNIYAEIHWPKIKESYNHSSDTMEARYPHVHVVIPKRNLLTGGLLNPVGMHEQSVKYLDAIQEKLNRDNGLSSPRENPRVGNNHYESALAKYKEKEFKSKNGEVKREIYKNLIDRNIRTWESFNEMLREYGEVIVRNAGSSNPYAAVKIPGDAKFTNLKGNIFNLAHIEQRALILDPITDAQVLKRIETWQQIQSREIKFISNASSKVKAHYKSLGLPERREYLTLKESQYEQRHRQRTTSSGKKALPSLPTGNYKPSNFEFTGGIATEGARYLHELRTRDVDHFGSPQRTTDRLFLQGNEDHHIQYLSANGDSGLRRDLYAGGRGRGGHLTPIDTNPGSSVLGSLIVAERSNADSRKSLHKYAEIRKQLDPYSFLAHVQIKYGVDPAKHQVTKAKDGSARIRVGKYNYNVSDFLTKHIGLSWEEAAKTLDLLYEKQVNGIHDKPKSKVSHIGDWRKFRNEVFSNNIKTYDQLKNDIKYVSSKAFKSIQSEYYTRRRAITSDTSLTRSQKHYFRSVIILEKLQKIEALREDISTQNRYNNQIKYPYSTLFYNFVTKEEDFHMQILNRFKREYQPTADQLESPNSIGSGKAFTPENMPSGAEAAKRARLVAQLQQRERETKEVKLKLGDLRPQPLASGAVAFKHKEHGKQIFINHPDRLELNRVTEPDEVAVSLIYAIERFGSPLEIKGTEEFKRQVIEVTAERDMDITFTDETMNEALAAKRKELGMQPLQSNSIAVAEIKLDTSLPLDKAVDKALLESKVTELTEINSASTDLSDSAIRRQFVMGMLERHEEINSGFISNKQITDIALEDIAIFKHLEGKPEQQEVALLMQKVMQSKDLGAAYSSTVTENGPAELMLTIHASRVIQERAEGKTLINSADDKSTDLSKDKIMLVKEVSTLENNVGRILDHGKANFNFEKDSTLNYYVRLTDDSKNEKVIWGVDLERAVAENGAEVGDLVELEKQGKRMVTIDSPVKNDSGEIVSYEKKDVERNMWEVKVIEPVLQIDTSSEKTMEVERSAAMQRILAQSNLIEMNLRHEKLKASNLPASEVAKADLEAFTQVKVQSEKNSIAVGIDEMMISNADYRDYVTQNAPEDLYVTIGFANAQQDLKIATSIPKHDNDIEM